MLTRAARPGDLEAVRALLDAAGLPLAGVPEHLGGFVVAEDAGRLVGVAGLEAHGRDGLLRSVAVAPAFRGRGVAARLVSEVVEAARARGLVGLSLLTTTAEGYFLRFGFERLPRAGAPPTLSASREFQDACPASAALLHLPLKENAMTLTAPTTDRTQAFLDALAPHADKALVFAEGGEALVRPGYHVTEVKAVTIEAMDCGGHADAWRETVVQLQDDANPGGDFMTVAKFLSIYGKVAASVPVRGEAELRVEYGNEERPAIQYRVGGVEVQPGRVLVHLMAPGVSCKPSVRRAGASGLTELPLAASGACCG